MLPIVAWNTKSAAKYLNSLTYDMKYTGERLDRFLTAKNNNTIVNMLMHIGKSIVNTLGYKT